MNCPRTILLLVLASAVWLGAPAAPAAAKNIGDSLMVITTDENGVPIVGGGGGGGGAVTVADGANVVLGATTDTAVPAGDPGTISGKVRNIAALVDALNTALSTLNAKLPSAAAIAAGTANPTVSGIGVYPHTYNGSTWDPMVKADSGAGNVTSATQRIVLANNSIPCTSYAPINQAADATVITGTASQYIYPCAIVIKAQAADTISIWEGTGTACGTGSTAIVGSTTESEGVSISGAGDGFVMVSAAPFMRTATTGNNLCIRQTGTSRLSGMISYIKAP